MTFGDFLGKKAQGTIEYLVIIAVVVVVALVVVGLLVGFFGSFSGVSGNSSNVVLMSANIGVTESVVNSDGNFAVKLVNNTGDILTISKVRVGGDEVLFSEDLAQGGSKFFVVDSSSVCEEGKIVSEDLFVTYVNKYGIQKTERYASKVFFDCASYNVNATFLANQCPDCGDSCVGGDQSLNPNNFSMLAGCYQANDLNTIDTNLVSSNIVDGVNIFGVVGNVAESTPGYFALSTGQLFCFNSSASSAQTCDVEGFPGQEAEFYGSDIERTFVDNGLTVSDSGSGLMWQKGDSGSGCSPVGSWQTALQYCDSFNAGGSRDGNLVVNTGWRLPNIIELLQTFDFNNSNYYSVFGTGTNYYWSSTTRSAQTTEAYRLTRASATLFGVGNENKANCGARARCVRFEE